jgi:transcriptional regulator with XRE-family HTH domain
MQRMRTGTDEQETGPQEAAPREEPPQRKSRIGRKEPGRRVREQAAREERAAEVAQQQARAEPRKRAQAPLEAATERPEAAARRLEEPPPPEPQPPAEEEPVPTHEVEPSGVVERLAGRLAAMRAAHNWSLQDLARHSGVSRSTLSRIERGQISPTAEVLIKLAGAYDRTLSGLLAEVEAQPRSLVRAAEQTVAGEDAWRRRAVSPPFPGLRGSVVDAQLMPASDVVYEPPVAGAEQHLWLITGMLEVTLGREKVERTTHADVGEEGGGGDFVLVRGDCLRLRLWGPTHLRCLSPDPARYALLTVAP